MDSIIDHYERKMMIISIKL